ATTATAAERTEVATAGRAVVAMKIVLTGATPRPPRPPCDPGRARRSVEATAKVVKASDPTGAIATLVGTRKAKARVGLSGTLAWQGIWTWKTRRAAAAGGCSGTATTTTARRGTFRDDVEVALTIGSTTCSKSSPSRQILRRKLQRPSPRTEMRSQRQKRMKRMIKKRRRKPRKLLRVMAIRIDRILCHALD
ncbi:unnamed protein product, partial [Durusdinium trenchii]